MAYVRLIGPETLRMPGDPTRFVSSREDYMVWLDRMLNESGRAAELSISHMPIEARIEHGRWLIDCACGCGALTRPDWGLACCGECGTVYDSIRFPADHEEIAAALLLEPARAHQSWTPPRAIIVPQLVNPMAKGRH